MSVALIAVVVTGVLLALYAAASILLARAVVYPSRARPTQILSVGPDGQVVLSSNPLTRSRGILGLMYDSETQLAVLTAEPVIEEEHGRVTRHLVAPAALTAPADGRASGNIFTSTNVTDGEPEPVEIRTDRGSQPAWLYAGEGAPSSTWVIHVHGMLAARESALRSVRSVATAGYTSLVISYRGDGEAIDEGKIPSSLGQTEWRDLDAAIAFAQGRGAKKIVVLGWSLGGKVALEFAAKGEHKAAVAGLILVAPVVSWHRTIHYGMQQQRIPRWLASAAIATLTSHTGARLLGLSSPLQLRNSLPSVPHPTLVIHSPGDRTTPFEASEAFAATSPLVTLDRFPASPHAMEWNADPDRFSASVLAWIVANSQQCRASG